MFIPGTKTHFGQEKTYNDLLSRVRWELDRAEELNQQLKQGAPSYLMIVVDAHRATANAYLKQLTNTIGLIA